MSLEPLSQVTVLNQWQVRRVPSMTASYRKGPGLWRVRLHTGTHRLLHLHTLHFFKKIKKQGLPPAKGLLLALPRYLLYCGGLGVNLQYI